ncbi:SGNH hydrolase, partial [Hortaea werneckii]
YRLDGLDWMLTNVTTSSTHLLISPETTGFNLTTSGNGTSGNLTEAYRTFEMPVTNWAYGVQIQNVHVAGGAGRLVRIPEYTRRMELIGDSLSAGQYATLEGISSYSWGLMYGLGNTEFSVTAYPGICLHDSQCYGNVHGQELQWLKVPDTSYRAYQIYGEDPDHIPNWNFTAQRAADITVINLGTNDHNPTNNITAEQFSTSYTNLITTIQHHWPGTQIIVVSLWIGFTQVGSSYTEDGGLDAELQHVVRYFNNGSLNTRGECEACSVYYFNSTGILQHNDLGPLYHPTDVE